MNPSAADAAPAGTGTGGARPATIMIAVASGFVMAMLDVTIVNVALKAMQDSLALSLTALVWVVDAYTLSFAALLLLGGSLANRFGSRTIYQTGLVIFVAASLLCAAATTPAILIAARLLQGVGAALFMPSSLSLLTLAFSARAAARADDRHLGRAGVRGDGVRPVCGRRARERHRLAQHLLGQSAGGPDRFVADIPSCRTLAAP